MFDQSDQSGNVVLELGVCHYVPKITHAGSGGNRNEVSEVALR